MSKEGDRMDELFFIMVTTALILTTRSFGRALFGKRIRQKKERQHTQEIQDFIEELHEANIVPVLKEQNITHFLVEEGMLRLHISYNQQDVLASFKADTYGDGFYETIYSFRYDEKEDKLISTSRNEDVYTKEMYNELNPFLAKLTKKISDVNWNQKEREVIYKPSDTTSNADDNSHFKALREKALVLLKNSEYLNQEDEKRAVQLIKHELEKTVQFYQDLNESDKEKYEPVIEDKMKEIDMELELLVEKTEEEKYMRFKEKLKKIVIEDEKNEQ